MRLRCRLRLAHRLLLLQVRCWQVLHRRHHDPLHRLQREHLFRGGGACMHRLRQPHRGPQQNDLPWGGGGPDAAVAPHTPARSAKPPIPSKIAALAAQPAHTALAPRLPTAAAAAAAWSVAAALFHLSRALPRCEHCSQRSEGCTLACGCVFDGCCLSSSRRH